MLSRSQKNNFVLVWPLYKKHRNLEEKPRISKNKAKKLCLHQSKV